MVVVWCGYKEIWDEDKPLGNSVCEFSVNSPADGVRDVPDRVEVWLVDLTLASYEPPSLRSQSVQQGV